MTSLEKSIKLFFDQKEIDLHSNNLLLACSGGLDSMTLANVLLSLDANFSLAHCNFGLRGKESDTDQAFVESFAEKHRLKYYVRSFNTKEYVKSTGLSTQMAARELRYDFFDKTIAENGIDFLLTAHHIDDSLETILINIGRGTGIKGLSGIPSHRANILRPMHLVDRKEIEDFAHEKQIEWREDSSNQSDDYQRNYLRHNVIPALKISGESYVSGLKKSLLVLEKDNTLFQHQLESISKEISSSQNNVLSIDLIKLKSYPSISTLLVHLLSPFGDFDIHAIEKSLDAQSGREFFSKTHKILKDREKLLISPIEEIDIVEYKIEKDCVSINSPLPMSFKVLKENFEDFERKPQSASLDFDKLEFPLSIRRWQEGDSFVPLGMKNSKKLSDFFIDQKLSRLEKSKVWLLCSGNKIVWIIGHRINDLYKVTKTTKTAYFVRPLNQLL